ncbi:hypothetical protein V9T40_007508 [Parthenolecanium corni]|uniref:Uncharacterized protein n=1 Tax=Parthenolecanium corni TaxID=536013 RepID=A0AAN9TLS6_9HEMI
MSNNRNYKLVTGAGGGGGGGGGGAVAATATATAIFFSTNLIGREGAAQRVITDFRDTQTQRSYLVNSDECGTALCRHSR